MALQQMEFGALNGFLLNPVVDGHRWMIENHMISDHRDML